MEYKIYKLTSPEGKVYIGLTKLTLTRRWNAGSGYSHNERLFADISQYGWDNFTHELIDTAPNKAEGQLKERKYIAEYDSANPEKGYNIYTNKSGGRTKRSKYRCVETGRVYKTQQAIADEVGVSRQRVSQCVVRKEDLRGFHYVAVSADEIGVKT